MRFMVLAAASLLLCAAARADKDWFGQERLAISTDGKTRIHVLCSGSTTAYGDWRARLYARDASGAWTPLWSVRVHDERKKQADPIEIRVEGPEGVALRTYANPDAARAAGDPKCAVPTTYAYEISGHTRFRLFCDRLYLETTWGERFCFSIPSGASMTPEEGAGIPATSLYDLAIDPTWFGERRQRIVTRVRPPQGEDEMPKGTRWVAASAGFHADGTDRARLVFPEGAAEITQAGDYVLDVERGGTARVVRVLSWTALAPADLDVPQDHWAD